MNIIDANIGSAKDNMSSPVHNWYKFTAKERRDRYLFQVE